jgi:hypothetical protein
MGFQTMWNKGGYASIKLQRSRPNQLTELPRSLTLRGCQIRENIEFNQREKIGRIIAERGVENKYRGQRERWQPAKFPIIPQNLPKVKHFYAKNKNFFNFFQKKHKKAYIFVCFLTFLLSFYLFLGFLCLIKSSL